MEVYTGYNILDSVYCGLKLSKTEFNKLVKVAELYLADENNTENRSVCEKLVREHKFVNESYNNLYNEKVKRIHR